MSSDLFRVRAEVDLGAIRTNIINMQKGLKGGTKTCCVIKADGYGHGAVRIAQAVSDIADFYAVATIDEALELRSASVALPILILGYINPDFYREAIENDIRLTVFDVRDAAQLAGVARKCAKKAKIHIKVDTGMGRIGFFPDEAGARAIEEIFKIPEIEAEGIFTHFYASDSQNKESAYAQLNLFNRFCAVLKERKISIPIRHCSNSAAAISMPQANLDMVRLGISQYGLYPSDDVHELRLFPAMSLISHAVMVKTIPAGCSVGYGATYTAGKETKVATIPVGYADGYARSLSNKGRIIINGQYAPVIGRVCMDQFMADVSGIEGVKKGSEAVLIGSMADAAVSMEEVAELSGRFNYEFACAIGKRVPRVYI